GPPTTAINGSVTITLVNATLPVFLTLKLYKIVSPKSAHPLPFSSAGTPTFIKAIAGFWQSWVIVGSSSNSLLSSDRSLTVVPEASVPVAVAWFSTNPASISVCVIMYVAVNVVPSAAPGANVIGPPFTVTNGSVI